MDRYRVLTQEGEKVAAYYYDAASYVGALRQFEALHPGAVAVHVERQSAASEWHVDGNARKVLETVLASR